MAESELPQLSQQIWRLTPDTGHDYTTCAQLEVRPPQITTARIEIQRPAEKGTSSIGVRTRS